MKILLGKSLLILLTLVTVIASCGDASDALNDINEPGLLQVSTFSPNINQDDVTFNGRVTKSLDGEFRYGFMWYISDENQFTEPTKIPVGTSSSSLDFDLDINSLPKGLNLVVCAYAESVVGEGGGDVIGNEEEFELPR